MDALTRRGFLNAAVAATAGAIVGGRAVASSGFGGTLCLFSKHLPELPAKELGRAVAALGFGGVDLTVRPGGHVLPERAAVDLPPFLAAVREQGLEVPMITTGLVSAADPTARPILETAGRHQVRFFKPGYYRYAFVDVRQELERAAADLRGLAALAAECGVQLGYHNHAGYIGGPVWDSARLMEALDPRWAGYYFDVRHAVVEGGDGGWRAVLNLVAPRLKMVAIKDFFWEKGPEGWRQRNCPLGEGMVDWKEFFAALARGGFHGPVSLHLEYDLPGPAGAKQEATLAAAARDLAFLKAGLARAYGAAPVAAAAGGGIAVAAPRPTDVRIAEVRHGYEDWVYRAPYRFGGRTVDKVTILNVRCRVETRGGRSAWGFGSMTLGNMWAFPSPTMPYEATLGAMKALAERIARIAGECTEVGHPLDLDLVLEPAYLAAAAAVSRELRLDQPIPKLCTLVVGSAFDAALHDAFGKVHGRNVYATYGPDLTTHDLSRYLGGEFEGERLDRYLLDKPPERIPLFHSVGGLDPLEATDVKQPVGDGLPETLPEWIRFNGLVRVKIKLSGEDLEGDVERTLRIDRVTAEAQARRGVKDWKYCLDFNERCPNVGYVLDFLRRVRAGAPEGFARILYVEQPTARDLEAGRANVMHEAARLRPVVIDESLTGLDSLRLARAMGYNGVALKACKGQSQAVLMAAAAQKYGMFLCVQDLTCPGASLIHSVGISAHVPAVAGIEANARQYVPAANGPWEKRFPGVFGVTDGHLRPAGILGPGLGIPDDLVPRF